MVEPTETESVESLEADMSALEEILRRAESDPEYLKNEAYSTPVRHLDGVKAARQPVIKYQFG